VFQVVAVAPPTVRSRFEAAVAHEPLSALPASARAELDEILALMTAFEDLPGWWQAALLRAEAARAGQAPPPRACCGA
jgi:hypothetical protein